MPGGTAAPRKRCSRRLPSRPSFSGGRAISWCWRVLRAARSMSTTQPSAIARSTTRSSSGIIPALSWNSPPTDAFTPNRGGTGIFSNLWPRLGQDAPALWLIAGFSLLLAICSLALPAFSKIFVDHVLMDRQHTWTGALVAGMLLSLALVIALDWLRRHYVLKLRTKLSLVSASGFMWHLLSSSRARSFSQRFAPELTQRAGLNEELSSAPLLPVRNGVPESDPCGGASQRHLPLRARPGRDLPGSPALCRAPRPPRGTLQERRISPPGAGAGQDGGGHHGGAAKHRNHQGPGAGA